MCLCVFTFLCSVVVCQHFSILGEDFGLYDIYKPPPPHLNPIPRPPSGLGYRPFYDSVTIDSLFVVVPILFGVLLFNVLSSFEIIDLRKREQNALK